MNIIYIRNGSYINQDIERAFRLSSYTPICLSAPPKDNSDSSNYLNNFMLNVKNNNPTFVFSIDFYPFISLACGAMGIPYVAWLIKGYDISYYSVVIRNEWNYIFVVDSLLYHDLHAVGVPNCYFLPLAAPTYDTHSDILTDNVRQYKADVSMIGSIQTREEMPNTPLSASNSLKDATKGYLEGCIACQHQFRSMPSMSSRLPDYVWSDLINTFPPNLENSLLSAQQFYDYNFFNPAITYADRDIHLNAYTHEERYQRIHLYTKSTSYNSEKIINCGWADYYKEIPQIVYNSKINLVITNRNYRAGISPVAWAIMGAKGFLLSNHQEDYLKVFTTTPALYQTTTEMLSKSAYYYHHEDERIALTEEIYQEISAHHTYDKRIQEMLSLLS